ncbi:hypothetical protein [Bradyrhizobium sp. 23]|uniref:hypothetical protein n=1 Tax=Bradyrhizobium sp. 23 TaxID=2782667 RepID=UPI001FFB8287|nr:hypothetical protein [Bradyrhizobium sp. 23]
MIFQRRGSHSIIFDYHFGKLVKPLTATFTTGATRGFDDTFDRRVIWQGTPRRWRILCASA